MDDQTFFEERYFRQAEVLIEGNLPLDSLRYVQCRSRAERATLLALADPEACRQWVKLIVCEEDLPFRVRVFTRDWLHVVNVEYYSVGMVAKIHQGKKCIPWVDNIPVLIEVQGITSGKLQRLPQRIPVGAGEQEFEFYFDSEESSYRVTMEVDGELAFQHYYLA